MTTRFRSRPRGGRGGRASRRMDWYGAAVNTVPSNIAPGGTTAAYTLLPSQMLALSDPTLIRTRGILSIYQSAISTTGFGAFGLIPWSDINDAVPTESLPNPFTNSNLDWLWLTYWDTEGGTNVDAYKMQFRVEIDSKAMRRLGSDRGVLAVGAVSSGATASNRFYYAVRHLVKE